MKPGLDVKNGWPTDGWASALVESGDVGQVGSGVLARPERKQRSPLKAQRQTRIRVTRRYGAPPARVFDAWLDPEVAGRWLFATASHPMAEVEIDARVEGSFRFVDQRNGEITEYTGEYTEIVPHRRLVFTLSLEQHPQVVTRVTVGIVPLNRGCELTLIHEHVPQDRADPMAGRWTGILYGLGVTLDSPSTAAANRSEP